MSRIEAPAISAPFPATGVRTAIDGTGRRHVVLLSVNRAAVAGDRLHVAAHFGDQLTFSEIRLEGVDVIRDTVEAVESSPGAGDGYVVLVEGGAGKAQKCAPCAGEVHLVYFAGNVELVKREPEKRGKELAGSA